jgi:hypothetical protein
MGSERHVVRDGHAGADETWHIDAVEVLLEMPNDIGVVGARRQHVDETEQLVLEVG